MMHHYYGAGWGWFGLLATLLVMLVFWGGVIALAVLLVRHFRPTARGQRSAETILSERFARGELDEEEYRQRLSVLHQGTKRT